jgi:hypothetical protein
MSNEMSSDTSLNNTSSLDNSWLLYEHNVSDISIISSQASDTTNNSENTSISLRKDESLNSSLSGSELEPFIHLTSSVLMSPAANEPYDFKSSSQTIANTIYDSYNLNINEVLPMLSTKTQAKLESVVGDNKSSLTNSKIGSNKSVTAQNVSDFASDTNKKNDYIIKANQEKNQKNAFPARSNILEQLKSGKADSKDHSDFILSILSKKQRTFISDAKTAHFESIKLTEEAKDMNKFKKESQFMAAFNEKAEILQENSEDKFNFRLIKSSNVQVSAEEKPKIAAPNHEEPKIDLTSLLEANQTDVQLMISQIKEKNKSFIGAILDD